MDDYEIITRSEALYFDASALAKIDIEEDTSSNLIRLLVFQPQIPVFSSFVGFGEFFHVAGKKTTQRKIGVDGYLFSCRRLMIDFDNQKIKRTEPVGDKFKFVQLARTLLRKHRHLGGGDLWHLMTVLELKQRYPATVLLSFDNHFIAAARSENIDAVHCTRLDSDKMGEHLNKMNSTAGD